MERISHVVLSDSTSNILEVTGIPGTYKDLLIFVSARGTRNTVVEVVDFRPNGQTANRSIIKLYTETTVGSVVANTIQDTHVSATLSTADNFGQLQYFIQNYTSTAAKRIIGRFASATNTGEQYMGMLAFKWADSSAITSFQIAALNANFEAGTTVTVMGI